MPFTAHYEKLHLLASGPERAGSYHPKNQKMKQQH
jgi:hypothetical protein